LLGLAVCLPLLFASRPIDRDPRLDCSRRGSVQVNPAGVVRQARCRGPDQFRRGFHDGRWRKTRRGRRRKGTGAAGGCLPPGLNPALCEESHAPFPVSWPDARCVRLPNLQRPSPGVNQTCACSRGFRRALWRPAHGGLRGAGQATVHSDGPDAAVNSDGSLGSWGTKWRSGAAPLHGRERPARIGFRRDAAGRVVAVSGGAWRVLERAPAAVPRPRW